MLHDVTAQVVADRVGVPVGVIEQPLHRIRRPVTGLFGQRGREYTDEEADLLLEHGAAAHVDQMLTYSAIGTPPAVREAVERFAKHADADELIVAHQSPTPAARLRSVELLAEAMAPPRS